MGLQSNKYHISKDVKVYKINEDGSFTSVGNIEDIEKRLSSMPIDKTAPIPTSAGYTSGTSGTRWWNRNYNWLWVTTLIVFIGWFISCLSCAWPEYPYYNKDGYIINYYTHDNTNDILVICAVILLCYRLSWFLSEKDKIILKLAQILLVGFAGWAACLMFWLCEQKYSFILVCLAIIPLIMWIVTLCLSIFTRR